MSHRALRMGLYVALFLGLFLGMAAAQIPATDDSYAASSNPSSNFGTQSMLDVIGPGVNSYIRFDLTALPAGLTGSNVSKATVRLNVNGVTTGGTFDVYEVTKSWTEGSINYNNAPALGTKVNSAVMIPTSKRNFVDVDVTQALQDWLNGSQGNYGIALVPSSGSSISVSFDSKENTSTSHDPELTVSLISAGPPGQAATLSVGSTTTLAPGSLASVSNSGTSSAAVLNFAIPQGAQGLQGAQGTQGPAGSAATVVAGSTVTLPAGLQAIVTNSGTSNAAILNFQIPQGTQGTPGTPGTAGTNGLPGAAATVQVGTVTTGDPGSQASVANVGTANAAVLNFSIPQGSPGSGGGGFNGVQDFTEPGTFPFTVPLGVTHILVELWGAGGGGGSTQGFEGTASGGGGSGGYIRSVLAVSPGATYNVIVGAGGAAILGQSSNGVPGNPGGDSEITDSSSTVLAFAGGGSGGLGGSFDSQGAVVPGAGGAGGTVRFGPNTVARYGTNGTAGIVSQSGGQATPGQGGNAPSGSISNVGGGGTGGALPCTGQCAPVYPTNGSNGYALLTW
jgi:hypothetical protein